MGKAPFLLDFLENYTIIYNKKKEIFLFEMIASSGMPIYIYCLI